METKKQIGIVEKLGLAFEKSRENNDLEGLYCTVEEAKELDSKIFDIHTQAIYHYFLGNAWSYIQKIKYPEEEFPLHTIELERQIVHLRTSLSLIQDCEDEFNECQILTNLGSLFSHIGRFSEAQEYFNLCLDIDDNFGMAIGNRGFALYYYARVIFEPSHQFIFMQYARKDLLNSTLSNQVYDDAKNAFLHTAKHIETAFPSEQLDDFRIYEDVLKGLNKCEVEYKEWCLVNRLFINPLNDVFLHNIVAKDYLFTPSMIFSIDEKPIYHSLFNQLKQEFVSARFLFYEALNENKPHFSDKDVLLMDIMDYSIYSFTLEKVKIAFRMSYSIFDKIAYFINLYLKLDHNPNRVNFRNVWYNNTDKKKGIDDKISLGKNWAMRGLFWLSKDLYEKDFDLSIEPEAKEIAMIRNYIEHKSFKIVESYDNKWSEKGDSFVIDRTYFYDKTFKLLKLSRSALMYLSFLIYDNERDKSMKNKLNIPVDFVSIDDNEKI